MTIANAKPDLLITGPIGTSMVNAASSAWHDYLTVEAKITAAIAYAVSIGAKYCYVPDSFLPYTASLVTFNSLVHMVREGGPPNASWFDVAAYGAKGDGVTDSLPSFTGAIAGMSGGAGTLYITASSFAVNGEILANLANMTIQGEGTASKITQISTGNANVVHLQAANIKVRNLWLVGNGVRIGGATPNQNVLYVDGAHDALVEHCLIDNGVIAGIQISSALRCKIQHNKIVNTNTAGLETNSYDIFLNSTGAPTDDNEVLYNKCLSTNVYGGKIIVQNVNTSDSCKRNKIIGNTCTTALATVDGVRTGHGIVLYSVTTPVDLFADNLITGNIIKDCQGMGIYVKGASTVGDVRGTIVAHNQIINCGTIGTGGTLADGCISVLGAPHTIVHGNKITGGGAGIHSAAIKIREFADETVIDGNQIYAFTQEGIHIGEAAGANYANGCIVANNIIQGANDCIYIQEGSEHLVIGNRCLSALNDSVRVGANATNCTVSHTKSRLAAGRAVNVLAGATNTTVEHNRSNGDAVTFTDAGTASIFRRNRWTAGAVQGRAVLVAGTVTVNTAEVLATDNIILSKVVKAGTDGFVEVSAIVAGTSFTILSSNGADTGTVFWEIVH